MTLAAAGRTLTAGLPGARVQLAVSFGFFPPDAGDRETRRRRWLALALLLSLLTHGALTLWLLDPRRPPPGFDPPPPTPVVSATLARVPTQPPPPLTPPKRTIDTGGGGGGSPPAPPPTPIHPRRWPTRR